MNPTIRYRIEKELDSVVKEPKAHSSIIELFGIKTDEEAILAYIVGLLVSRFFDVHNEVLGRDPNQAEINEFRDLVGRRIAEVRNAFVR